MPGPCDVFRSPDYCASWRAAASPAWLLDSSLTFTPSHSTARAHPAPPLLPQFADLQRESGLQAPLLKTALLILIQQNYVACYLKQEPPTLRGPGPKYTLYEAVLPRMLQVLRWVLEPRPLVSCA